MQNRIRLLVSVLLTASVTSCVAIPDYAPGKQLINLVPTLIGKDSSLLVESLGQPHDEVWVNDTKHVTWRRLQLIGECQLSIANKGGKIVSVHWSGPLTGCHYLEAKIKELNLNN